MIPSYGTIRPTRDLLTAAQAAGYAVGAFNVFDLMSAQAVCRAARATMSPVIVQVTENSLAYAGETALIAGIRATIAAELGDGWPVALHLDHGKSVAAACRMVDCGFSSVMIDASRLPYEENVAAVRAVVAYARERGVSVQAEIGSVFYGKETAAGQRAGDHLTDPDQAAAFVDATGCDTLAVAIGNAHGDAPELPEPDFARLAAIRSRVAVPIVLHGASDWEGEKAAGAIAGGVACFNVDTDSRVALTAALTAYFRGDDISRDPRVYFGVGRDAIQAAVAAKMRLLGSADRVADAPAAGTVATMDGGE